jgi:hypothetical protein
LETSESESQRKTRSRSTRNQARPRYVGMGGGGGRNRLKIFRLIRVLCRRVNRVTLIINFREQKRLEQTNRRGRRLSILGLFQHEISLVYGLVIGGVDRKAYIKMMESEAQSASQSKRIRVIVQDNGPIHRCHEVQQLWSKWESLGLYILFLPKYCSEMNPI